MALAVYNLGTKLMRWTSSIDYDHAGVSSLTICQSSDEGEVRGEFFANRHTLTLKASNLN